MKFAHCKNMVIFDWYEPTFSLLNEKRHNLIVIYLKSVSPFSVNVEVYHFV